MSMYVSLVLYNTSHSSFGNEPYKSNRFLQKGQHDGSPRDMCALVLYILLIPLLEKSPIKIGFFCKGDQTSDRLVTCGVGWFYR